VDAATRVLVLANPTADSIEARQQLLARHGQGPIAVTVLAAAIRVCVAATAGGAEAPCKPAGSRSRA
jgi:hypothetical protein